MQRPQKCLMGYLGCDCFHRQREPRGYTADEVKIMRCRHRKRVGLEE